MLCIDCLTLQATSLGHACRSLDETANFMELLIKKDQHRDRAKLTLIEVLIHDVKVLVAQEDAQVELAALLGNAAKNGQVVDNVAAPVLGQHQYVERVRQGFERPQIGRGSRTRGFLSVKTLRVTRHLSPE